MEAQTLKSDPELDLSTEAGTDFSSILFIWYAESRFGTSWISVSHDSPEETWGIEGTASLVSPQTSTDTVFDGIIKFHDRFQNGNPDESHIRSTHEVYQKALRHGKSMKSVIRLIRKIKGPPEIQRVRQSMHFLN